MGERIEWKDDWMIALRLPFDSPSTPLRAGAQGDNWLDDLARQAGWMIEREFRFQEAVSFMRLFLIKTRSKKHIHMTLEERINQEIKVAMMAKDKVRLEALRAVKSAIDRKSVV